MHRIYRIHKIHPVNLENLVNPVSTNAAIRRAETIARAMRTDEPCRRIIDSLQHQLPDHLHERRMRARSRRAHHFKTQLASDVLRLEIEIVNDLHVIRHKPDGRNYQFFHTFPRQRPQVIQNIRSKPRLHLRTTATLINELPVIYIQLVRNQTASLSKLRSEEHTSELQSHSFISYAVFCLKKTNKQTSSTMGWPERRAAAATRPFART